MEEAQLEIVNVRDLVQYKDDILEVYEITLWR